MSTKAEIENSIAKKTAQLRVATSSDERKRIEANLRDLRAALAQVGR